MRIKGWSIGIVILLFLFPGKWINSVWAQSGEDDPDGPKRTTQLNIDINLYTWWLSRWDNNNVACEIVVEHEELPTPTEIYNSCGPDIYEDWQDTPFCNESDVTKCSGVYFHFAGTDRAQKTIEVELPPSEVWVSLEGCSPMPPDNRCNSAPRLKFTGEEPLPNETIIRIQGTINGQPFSCPGSECSIPLNPTGVQGENIEFWADSSFGDSSNHYTAMSRIIPWGDFMAPEGKTSDQELWYVDILSSQWRGERMASAADIWQVFPEVGGPPQWLQTPEDITGLSSNISYYYLAGMLIQNGAADASSCSDGGLTAGFTANACGVEAAMPQVLEWQNQFDQQILEIGRATGIPAQLMKNIFSRESQFWPGFYKTYREAGLGQLTSDGADTVLLWNPTFFSQFCPLVLSQLTCQQNFSQLSDYNQSLLRGALVQKVNAACPDCQNGIDLSQANFSVRVFAETLLANAEQTGQIIYNATRRSPGEVSTYNDLWRFTLVNYNAGPGCLSNAVEYTWDRGELLTWQNVAANLEEGCQDAVGYVNDITGENQPILFTNGQTSSQTSSNETLDEYEEIPSDDESQTDEQEEGTEDPFAVDPEQPSAPYP